jgi:opacity protein-like surface antigen
MNRIAGSLVALLVLLSSALVPASAARAQAVVDDEDPATAGGTTATDGSTTSTTTTTTTTTGGDPSLDVDSSSAVGASIDDDQALLEERSAPVVAQSDTDPRELEDVSYFFVGLLARGVIVPQFITSLFVSYGDTPVNGGFGIFFNYRRNDFNVQLELNYQGFGVDAYYRGTDEPESELEHIRSGLGLIYGNVSFGWAFDITDWFAFELGFGIGFGGLVGDLYRQAAYRDASGPHDCASPGNPATGGCAEDEWPIGTERPGDTGDPYQISQGRPNPHYFGSGGVPPVFFNIDLPRIAFRFKPIRQIQLRIDAAYNLYGFSFGASAAYGF